MQESPKMQIESTDHLQTLPNHQEASPDDSQPQNLSLLNCIRTAITKTGLLYNRHSRLRAKIAKPGLLIVRKTDAALRRHTKCDKTIKDLQQQIDVLRKEQYNNRNNAYVCSSCQKRDLGIPHKLVDFADSALDLKPAVITRTLLFNAKTLAEAEAIVRGKANVRNFFDNLRRKQREEIVNTISKQFTSVRRTFGKKENIRIYSDNLAEVFGTCVLARKSPEQIVYINKLIDLAGVEVICGHADGRFFRSPNGWTQSFELKLLLQKDNKQKAVTFAFGLLKKKDEASYEQFFKAASAYNCPSPPYLVTDYEIAISNGAARVWSSMKRRGCYYHYLNNLLNTKSKIKRQLYLDVSKSTHNFLKICPFLVGINAYFHAYIQRLGYKDDDLYRNVDFKLVIYVYKTYIRKLKCTFMQDPSKLTVRTNNSAEGSNGGLKKAFLTRPSEKEISTFITTRFKDDLAKKWKDIAPKNDLDVFLEVVHGLSERNMQQILVLCGKVGDIGHKNAKKLRETVETTRFYNPRTITLEDDERAAGELAQISLDYDKYMIGIKQQRKAYRSITIVGITSGIKPRTYKTNNINLADDSQTPTDDTYEAENYGNDYEDDSERAEEEDQSDDDKLL